MLRFDAALSRPSLINETPAASPLSNRGAFGQVFDAVQGEVADFIKRGSDTEASIPVVGAAHAWLIQGKTDDVAMKNHATPSAMHAFWKEVAPFAREAGAKMNVAPEIIAAQAALETGWGARPLRHVDGRDTHNYFALKATGGWNGEAAAVATTEVVGGLAQSQVAPFRSYEDAQSGFEDFTRLMLGNPRYQKALNTGNDARAYAEALVKGGYATDPAYADKLVGIVNTLNRRVE